MVKDILKDRNIHPTLMIRNHQVPGVPVQLLDPLQVILNVSGQYQSQVIAIDPAFRKENRNSTTHDLPSFYGYQDSKTGHYEEKGSPEKRVEGQIHK